MNNLLNHGVIIKYLKRKLKYKNINKQNNKMIRLEAEYNLQF